MRFPHFDFYPGDWISDGPNAMLSYEEQGVHMRLLCWMWSTADCAIPDDDTVIARVLGVPRRKWLQWRAHLVDSENAVFRVENGQIFSQKLRKIFAQAIAKSQKAQVSARSRWNPKPAPRLNSADATAMRTHSEGNANAERPQCVGNASHQSSVINHQKEKEKEAAALNAAHARETARAPDDVFEAAVDFVLPLLGRLQLRGTEGVQIQQALACVDHDLPRFCDLVTHLAQAHRAREPDRRIASFAYFLGAFADHAADIRARAAPRQPARAAPHNGADRAHARPWESDPRYVPPPLEFPVVPGRE